MSRLQIMRRLYKWLPVVGLACLLSSCTLALSTDVNVLVHETQPSMIVSVSGAQQLESGGVTRFVACDGSCAKPTPKTLGSVSAVATEVSSAAVTNEVIVTETYVDSKPRSMQVSVMFERDGKTLGPIGRRALRNVRSAMQSAAVIRIDGRTDDEGIQATNDKLASARALTVMLFVRDELLNGMKTAPELRATGLGKCCYVGDNKTSIGRAANRRVDVTVEAREPSFAASEKQRAQADATRTR